MRNVVNLVVIIVVGVIVADLVMPSHVKGTNYLLGGLSALWKVGVNGMLGKPTTGSVGVAATP